jgi:uncharacterized protein YjdB
VKKQAFSMRRTVFGVVLATVALACSDATGTRTEPVASVDIGGVPATVYVGATATLAATPRDAQGTALADRAVTWLSSDSTIAAVTAGGVVTGRAVGQAVIVATSEQQSATATVRVTLQPPAAMEITGAPAAADSVAVGTSVQLSAAARSAAGATIPGRVVTWTSADTAIATVSDSGLVRTRRAGQVGITAANEGVSTTVTLRVVDPVVAVEVVGGPLTPVVAGTVVQLGAVARNAAGVALTGRPVAWSSGNPEIATVSSGGTVNTLRGGEVGITAIVGAVSTTFALRILERVDALEITAPADSVLAGANLQLSAVARSPDGAPLTGRVITWSSSDPGRAVVSAAGVVQTLAPGEVVITATHQGVTATFALTVLERVAAVEIRGAPAGPMMGGTTVQLSAVARGASGAALAGRAVTWTASDPGMATVSPGGLVQAARLGGEVVITATVEGVGTSFTLAILEPVATLQVTGGPTGPVVAGAAFQLAAVARGAAGNGLSGRPVTWSSADVELATVSPTGQVQTRRAGEVGITAAVEGVTATYIVRILEPVASVQVVRAADSLVAGGTMQLRAVALSAAGDSLPGRAVFWVSSNYSVATVSANGLLTTASTVSSPVNVGITATVEGRSASFVMRVLPPVASVSVGSPFGGVYAAQTVQLAATPRTAAGTPIVGRAVTWSTSDASRATVDSAGYVTGVAPGQVTISAASGGQTGTVQLRVLAAPAGEWSQAATWGTHQGNARHTGFVPVTADPRAFDQIWARSPLGATALNPVTEGDGRVFVSGYAYFGGQTLAALNARTGTTDWSHAFGSIHGVHPPAFGNGRVYATTSGHGDSYLYAFDAASGTVAFRKPYGNQWSRYLAPVVSGETVYMAGGYYGGMYAFGAGDGDQRWTVATNQYDGWSPAVADGRVYAHAGNVLQVHDAATGASLFTINDTGFNWGGYDMRGSPALGALNNALVTQGGRLVSFNLTSRTVGWQRAGAFRGNVTVADGVLYVISSGQVEARRESDGSLLWVWLPPAGQTPVGTLVATKNLLFMSTASHTYAMDIDARVVTWSHAAGGQLALGRDGILFIAQESGMLTAVDLK